MSSSPQFRFHKGRQPDCKCRSTYIRRVPTSLPYDLRSARRESQAKVTSPIVNAERDTVQESAPGPHPYRLRKRSQAEVLPPRAKVNDCIKKQPKHQHQKTLEVGVNIAASVSVSTKHFDAIPEHTTAKRRHKSPHPLLLRDLWEGYKLFQARENAIQLLHIFALVIPTQPSL
uniref:Uncharacterized protein n=1 Tax=Coccidioides posadasii RMSCC 3488 TaxID=454284 RepID=A0A0J6IK66_COCPO|nr:hypothetical protein CPAG_08624 [Coccidioides posadasii RMSCC 3488]